jgi:hypothetical protein
MCARPVIVPGKHIAGAALAACFGSRAGGGRETPTLRPTQEFVHTRVLAALRPASASTKVRV